MSVGKNLFENYDLIDSLFSTSPRNSLERPHLLFEATTPDTPELLGSLFLVLPFQFWLESRSHRQPMPRWLRFFEKQQLQADVVHSRSYKRGLVGRFDINLAIFRDLT